MISLRSKFPLTAAILMAGLLGVAQAAVTYSGIQDINVTNDFDGVYLNIGSGSPTFPGPSDGVGTDTYTIGYTEPADWDINIFFGGIGIAYSDTFSPFVDGTNLDPNDISAGSQILNVAFGTDIQAAAATRALAVDSFGGSGTPEGIPGESHFNTPDLDGSTYSAFTPGGSGYIAFVIDIGGSDQYGWMRVTLNDDGSVGTIHEWAYSDEAGFTVGMTTSPIPEPSSLLMVLLASLGLLRRSRR